ncbi:RluA family pseudouridine synthase [Geomicrobium sp. JCM 19037]|uniref:RluA family pseudouridine synthase n=1 Tax=Geomicrobium sp. JCM 19037 TaxID=1460634 RepID=UPI0012695684|nr:RluA family pseudouridine synthase [Geomicrobium sp. JCM 19037]
MNNEPFASWTWTVHDDFQGTVSAYVKTVRHMSSRSVKLLKSCGKIRVNGERAHMGSLLQGKDRLKIHYPFIAPPAHFKPCALAVEILFEDDHLIAVNKPSGVKTLPGQGERGVSLAEQVIYYFQQTKQSGGVHPVSRLDQFTSGIVIFAKHRFAHDQLHKRLQEEVGKRYVAIVDGKLRAEEQTIQQPIARKEGSIIERTVSSGGDPAMTHYRKVWTGHDRTLLDVKLYTGRTHQIRVHMASIGFPITGDTLYGNASSHIARQALHCKSNTFTHPITNDRLHIEAPLPVDMLNMIPENYS